MPRRPQQIHRTGFHDAPRVHHVQLVREFRDDAEIVGDEQHG
jgi:hypothetical protein